MTQTERVLRALTTAGTVGITQGDFLKPSVCDDGPPITRVGARIKDLKHAGHAIRKVGTRDGFAVYVLPPADPPPTRDWPEGTPDWAWPSPHAPKPANALLA